MDFSKLVSHLESQMPTTAPEEVKFTAMVIRNAMEDFHCKHLSDAQMKELNPIIRNAVFTAIMALAEGDVVDMRFIMDNMMRIPKYWEEPELLDEYKRTVSPK